MKIKILFIEDEKILAEMYYERFKKAGFQIALAFTAKGALEILKKEKFDLILLDLLFPYEDGIYFLRKRKEIKTASSIPVVAVSNYDHPQTINQAYKLGIRDYLLKTQFTPSQLVEKIKEYL